MQNSHACGVIETLYENVTSPDLNAPMVPASLKPIGSEFQSLGAMEQKEHSPVVFKLHRFTIKRFSFDERRERDGSYVPRASDRGAGKEPSKCR